MTRKLVARLAAMDGRELKWRAVAAARTAFGRARFRVARPRWNRRDLAWRLAPSLADVQALIAAGHFDRAHRELSRHVTGAVPRFVIGAALRSELAGRIELAFPGARADAIARADRLLFGSYDLLGYRDLRFDGSGTFEWNYDPVHDRRAPRGFWSTVPYLDPATGDHKIIWELNRHQHWLMLGRAYWLTREGKYRDRCLAELASWIDANPPLDGINWSSMLELAFRSLSWLWALHFFADADAVDRQPWTIDLLLALDRQLTHVEHNLSYHFSPNTHLLGEALALYVTGRALPELSASARRAEIGRRILVDETARQIARDGGHCERSAHYHRYTLDFYLLAATVARITHDPVAGLFERAVGHLASAARLLADDTGHLPHLGDDDGGMLLPIAGRDPLNVSDSLATAAALLGRSDFAVAPPSEETFWLLANPLFVNHRESRISSPESLLRSAALDETGYFVSRWADRTHVVIDGGPHGYQNGGHAHADALSLTLRSQGIPLLIDPGTACYTADIERRNRFRSTAMHNTLTLDGRSQSIPAGPFHWSHKTDASVARWRVDDAFDYFEGWHDGYAGVVHRRHVFALHGGLLVVADLVDGHGAHTAAVHWHVDPLWHARVSGRSVVLSASRRTRLFTTRERIELFHADENTGLGWYSPAYGRVEPSTTIRIGHHAEAPFWMVCVFDLGIAQDVISADTVPVWAEANVLERSTGVRISRSNGTDYLLIAEPRTSDGGPTWRIAEFETDARMLYVRTDIERHATRVALVDGSVVRSAGRNGLHLALGHSVAGLHRHLETQDREPATHHDEPRTSHSALNAEP